MDFDGVPSPRQEIGSKSAHRTARLIVFAGTAGHHFTAREAARACEIPIASTYRVLTALTDEGLLAKRRDGSYESGPSFDSMVQIARQMPTPEYLIEPLLHLREATGETSYVAGWHIGEIRVLQSLEGTLPVRVSIPVGVEYEDPHARATGKVLLAFAAEPFRTVQIERVVLRRRTPSTLVDPIQFGEELDRTRARGYGVDTEEYQVGVGCLSVPVMRAGILLAAYSVSVPIDRFRARFEDLLCALRIAAQMIPNEQGSREQRGGRRRVGLGSAGGGITRYRVDEDYSGRLRRGL